MKHIKLYEELSLWTKTLFGLKTYFSFISTRYYFDTMPELKKLIMDNLRGVIIEEIKSTNPYELIFTCADKHTIRKIYSLFPIIDVEINYSQNTNTKILMSIWDPIEKYQIGSAKNIWYMGSINKLYRIS